MATSAIVGVVEGFYGRPWSQAQRRELLDKLYPLWGMNSYLYAPKDDSKHRQCWQVPYTQQEIDALLAPLIGSGQHTFWYGVAPGLTFRWCGVGDAGAEQEEEDTQLLLAKLQQLVDLGCGNFALLFDDIELPSSGDEALAAAAQRQAQLANRVLDYLRARTPAGPHPTLLFCPTVYCEAFASTRAAFCPYLRRLGASLHPDVAVLWTGPLIISQTITSSHVAQVQRALSTGQCGWRAVLLWDNLHANDYDMRRLYTGPYAGRESLRFSPSSACELGTVAGIFHNPNNEFPVNFVPLCTLAAFARQPDAYTADEAFRAAVHSWVVDYGAFALDASSSSPPLTVDDVALLCEFFYLPYEHGPHARALLDNWRRLLRDGCRASGQAVLATSQRVVGVTERLPRLADRELLYALYRYAWELREELAVVSKLAGHLLAGGSARSLPSGDVHRPYTYRGGVAADLQSLLLPNRVDGAFDLLAGLLPSEPLCIRPYRREWGDDEVAALYSICLRTAHNGGDASAMYADLPDILGDRWLGAYLALEPAGAVVLVRPDQPRTPLGYALAVADSRAFYRRAIADWLPAMRAKYPLPAAGLQPDVHPSHELIAEFHGDQPLIPAGAADLFDAYPSHLHIDLLPEAQSQGFGSRMMHRIFEYMRSAGSRGVHLEMALDNYRALEFYKKIGFTQLLELPSARILGMSFV